MGRFILLLEYFIWVNSNGGLRFIQVYLGTKVKTAADRGNRGTFVNGTLFLEEEKLRIRRETFKHSVINYFNPWSLLTSRS